MKDLGLLALRMVVGGLLAGHGAQKLFGAFEGPGLAGTRQMVARTGLHPPDMWAVAAGGSEFGGGVLTALGLLWPVGPITTLAPMGVAIGKVHWGKPIWAGKGGAELPLTNTAAALALAGSGPGRFSLDDLLGVTLPGTAVMPAAACTAAGLAMALYSSRHRQEAARAATPEQQAETSPNAVAPGPGGAR